MADRDPKICPVCGRRIEWRKKWERNWAEIKYCGEACRRHKKSDVGDKIEAAIVTLLNDRKAGDTICPSEAARLVGGDDWRNLMEPARAAARRLAGRAVLHVTQKGRIVDPSTAKGPIRLRLI